MYGFLSPVRSFMGRTGSLGFNHDMNWWKGGPVGLTFFEARDGSVDADGIFAHSLVKVKSSN